MEKSKLKQLLLPIGLICISGSLFFKMLENRPGNTHEFLTGFFIGLGFVLVTASFILFIFRKQHNN